MADLFQAATSHHRARRLGQAEALYRAALADEPDHAEARYGLGVLELQSGRPAAAVETLGRALEIAQEGRLGAVHQALASAFRRLGDMGLAVHHYRHAAALQPGSAAAALNLGAALGDAGLAGEASDAFARALALDPAMAEAREALAITLNRLGRHGEAERVCSERSPASPFRPALGNALAMALKEQGRLDAAAQALDLVLQAAPTDTDALYNLAGVRKDQGLVQAARDGYQRVLELDPGHAAARIALCMARLPPLYADQAAVQQSRGEYAQDLTTLAGWAEAHAPDALADGVGASQPFYLPYQGENDAALQGVYGRLMHRAMTARHPSPPLPPPPEPGERLRVGFVSGYFRDHANWRLPVRGWVEGLDRSRFELIGYHTSALQDGETQRIQARFDRFVQGPLSTEAWRARIAQDRPHVLIYPEIGMDPAAVRLAAQRLAPVQCNSWGHPTTSGLPTLDYFLSSDDMEPPDAQDSYTETLVRLPGLSTRVRLPNAPPPAPRSALGLAERDKVFWCAQSPYKYLPRHDDLFARIAARVPDCRFVFVAFPGSDDLTALFRRRLQSAFSRHGLDSERFCTILPRLAARDYRAAMAACDVMLDSLDWSGCNSVLDALACGLPVVALEGGAMRGRHGAAILRRAGREGCVGQTVDAYIALAVGVAAQAAPVRPASPQARRRLEARLSAGAPAAHLGRFLQAAVAKTDQRQVIQSI